MSAAPQGFVSLPRILQIQLEEFLDRPFAQTAAAYEETRQTLVQDRDVDPTRFQDGLTLKALIDNAENLINNDEIHGEGEVEKYFAVVLNADYVLFHLYTDVSLPINPFLSHWVDNIARWESKNEASAEVHGKALALRKARLYLAKTLLMEEYPPDRLSKLSPATLINDGPSRAKFSVETWIKTFPSSSPLFHDPDALSIFKNSISALYPAFKLAPDDRTLPSQLKQPQSLKLDDLLAMFKEDPEQTTFAIIHMPIDDIKCLELVNNLILRNNEDGLLYKTGVDVVGMVRDYIQHGLRQIEALGADGEDSAGSPTHPDEQVRAVKLLHLFIRNLWLKQFINIDQIRFELLELGLRYVWVKEVREDPLLADSGLSPWA